MGYNDPGKYILINSELPNGIGKYFEVFMGTAQSGDKYCFYPICFENGCSLNMWFADMHTDISAVQDLYGNIILTLRSSGPKYVYRIEITQRVGEQFHAPQYYANLLSQMISEDFYFACTSRDIYLRTDDDRIKEVGALKNMLSNHLLIETLQRLMNNAAKKKHEASQREINEDFNRRREGLTNEESIILLEIERDQRINQTNQELIDDALLSNPIMIEMGTSDHLIIKKSFGKKKA